MHLHVLAVNWKQSRLHGLFSDIMARIHGLFHPQKRHNIWGLEAQNICPWPGETCRTSLKIIQELKDTGSVLSWHPLFILNPTLTNKTSFWHHVFWGMHYFFWDTHLYISMNRILLEIVPLEVLHPLTWSVAQNHRQKNPWEVSHDPTNQQS